MRTDLDKYRYEPTCIPEALDYAGRIASSKLAPYGMKPNDIFLVMATGAEYGWSTMRSLRSLYVIDGKACMYADAIIGLCKASPECVWWRVVESTAESATVETLRAGSPESERMTYSREDATRAGLWGKMNRARDGSQRPSIWVKFPADMLRARASVRLARAVYADVVGGFYDPGEIHEQLPDTQAHVEDDDRRDIGAPLALAHEPDAEDIVWVPTPDDAPTPEELEIMAEETAIVDAAPGSVADCKEAIMVFVRAAQTAGLEGEDLRKSVISDTVMAVAVSHSCDTVAARDGLQKILGAELEDAKGDDLARAWHILREARR